jgi:hypothetical protein
MPLRHVMSFTEHGSRFELVEERIENERPYPNLATPYFFYRFQNGYPVLKESPGEDVKAHSPEVGDERELKRETLNPEQSILSQVKDPERYPVLAYLDSSYSQIAIYREWTFGRYTPPRQEQKADLRTDSEATALVFPFHSQSRTPPTSLTGADKSFGAACSRLIASRKLDFPDPFGPISTFSWASGSDSVSGPNESRFLIRRLLINILMAFSVPETR